MSSDMYGKGAVDMEKIDEIKRYYQTKKIMFAPLSATYELTLKCNLNCLHCYNQEKKDNSLELEWENKKEIIDKLVNLGVKEITLCGGEPLLDKNIVNTISYIKSKGIKLVILTNGLILNSYLMSCLKEQLTSEDIIQVSVDETKYKDDSQRKMSQLQYDILKKHIIELCELPCKIHSNTTITKYNENDILTTINDIIEWGVKSIGVTSYKPFGGRNMDSIKPNYNRLCILEKRVMQLCEKKGIVYTGGMDGHVCESLKSITIRNNSKQPSRRCCDASRFHIHVTHDGSIYPCVFMEYSIFKIGNIFNEERLIKQKALKLQEMIYTRFPVECVECDRLYECNGGCPGLIYDRFGILEERDPRCIYGKNHSKKLKEDIQ